ncbi:unnamed protein product [Sympodiomycopsis kandeliae]
MEFKPYLTFVNATLLGSMLLLLAMTAHQIKAQMVPVYSAHHQRALSLHHKRASSGSGSGGPSLHEHSTWNHPALHEGADLWPASSKASTPKASSPTPTFPVDSTGRRTSQLALTSHLDQGKAVASGSGAGASESLKSTVPPIKKMGRPVGVKDSEPRKNAVKKIGPTQRLGRPPGAKDTKPRISSQWKPY